MNPGSYLNDKHGGMYRIGSKIAEGGQGEVFEALSHPSGVPFILKTYHPSFETRETFARIDALVRYNLSYRSPALCGPLTTLGRGKLGVIMPKAHGDSLDTIFQTNTFGLMDALGVSAALCRALSVTEQLGIAHGDLAPSNVMARKVGDLWHVCLIDFDNAVLPHAPPPSLMGQELMAAPELVLATAQPSVETDRYALGALLHMILLGRHPYAELFANYIDFDVYRAALRKARWPDDPALGAQPPGSGLPVATLSRDLHGLFRRALQLDAKQRPSAREWARTLDDTLDRVFACDSCGEVFLDEASRYSCPYCGRLATMLDLDIAGQSIPLAGMSRTIGRDDVGGDPTVSRAHAAFHRKGHGVRARVLSENGIAVKRQVDRAWREVVKGREIDLGTGDRILFAPGVEGVLRDHGP